jgi:hypothetical protein
MSAGFKRVLKDEVEDCQELLPSSHRLCESQVVLPISASVAQIMRAEKLLPWPPGGNNACAAAHYSGTLPRSPGY